MYPEGEAEAEKAIENARTHFHRAAHHLKKLVAEACPAGPDDHRPQQKRDGKPPWCTNCGRTIDGVKVRSIT